MAGVTPETPGADGTNLAEPGRPPLCVTLSIRDDGEGPELAVEYVNAELTPSPRDPGYWDQVIDLR